MLRNAFDLLATEGTLRNLLRAMTFAKTSSDQLRVNVDNNVNVVGTITAVVNNGGNAGASMQLAANNPGLWSQTSWNATDARYQYGETLVGNYIQNRQRWVVS